MMNTRKEVERGGEKNKIIMENKREKQKKYRGNVGVKID